MPKKCLIRDAVPDDCPAVLQLIKDLAAFEEKPESVVEITPEIIEHDCFGKDKWCYCLVAEEETEDETKKIVGYAMFNHAYSTWKGRMLYLEDIYVAPSARKKGIGMAFLTKLSKIAVEKKCNKIRWCVIDWNQQAIDFYKYIGAEVEEEWKQVQLGNSAMLKLANRTLPDS
ncbi:diamine acetyltransferase 2-like [Actinia tenebrosa]|uniref:Diamine acetyltransferase 2-like n=1 Tax=Actinia tenebrosa TaxID=6105 RepID=A0A6P8HFI6_ACTTE|nr:diamine acetyltransferase 2-like [Actinia tenebrosa]